MASARKMPPPLRIVGPDDAPAKEQDEFRSHEAITRKVRNPLLDGAAPETPPPLTATASTATTEPDVPTATSAPAKTARLPAQLNTRRLIFAAVAMFGVVVGAAGLWKLGGKSARPPAPTPAAVPPPAQSPSPSPPSPAPAVATPPGPVLAPATSRIDISVQPAHATLMLDDTTAGGNRMRIDVPKDPSRHVVEASAPGYESFKKTISYAGDVFLEIELQRAPGLSRAGVKARSAPAPSRPKSDVRGKPAQDQAEDFGMNLGHPAARRPAKKIDEKDPYSP